MSVPTDHFLFDDLAPHVEPVRVFGTYYALREPSGDAVCKWRNTLAAATRMVEGKVSGVGNVADAEPQLVAACLYQLSPMQVPGGQPVIGRTVDGSDGPVVGYLRVDVNGNPDQRFLVPGGVVRGWPARYLKPLYQHLLTVAGLAEPEGDEALGKRIESDFRKLSTHAQETTVLQMQAIHAEAVGRNGTAADQHASSESGVMAKNSPNATTAGSA